MRAVEPQRLRHVDVTTNKHANDATSGQKIEFEKRKEKKNERKVKESQRVTCSRASDPETQGGRSNEDDEATECALRFFFFLQREKNRTRLWPLTCRLGGELVPVGGAHSQQPVAQVQVEALLSSHSTHHLQEGASVSSGVRAAKSNVVYKRRAIGIRGVKLAVQTELSLPNVTSREKVTLQTKPTTQILAKGYERSHDMK